jgi:hypothetical protein
MLPKIRAWIAEIGADPQGFPTTVNKVGTWDQETRRILAYALFWDLARSQDSVSDVDTEGVEALDDAETPAAGASVYSNQILPHLDPPELFDQNAMRIARAHSPDRLTNAFRFWYLDLVNGTTSDPSVRAELSRLAAEQAEVERHAVVRLPGMTISTTPPQGWVGAYWPFFLGGALGLGALGLYLYAGRGHLSPRRRR